MRHRLPSLVAALILTVLSVSSLLAQETTGTILGTLIDENGGVLPGVTVAIRHIETGKTFEQVTSAEGLFTAPLPPVGTYEVTFTLSGFESRVVRGVILSVNDRAADGIDNTCTVSTAACNVSGDRFGQLLSTRNPREIQLGLKVYR